MTAAACCYCGCSCGWPPPVVLLLLHLLQAQETTSEKEDASDVNPPRHPAQADLTTGREDCSKTQDPAHVHRPLGNSELGNSELSTPPLGPVLVAETDTTNTSLPPLAPLSLLQVPQATPERLEPLPTLPRDLGHLAGSRVGCDGSVDEDTGTEKAAVSFPFLLLLPLLLILRRLCCFDC